MTGFWTKKDQEWWDDKENQFIYNFNQLFTSGDYWDRTPENVKPREEALKKLYRESIRVQARVMPKIADIKKEFEEKFHPLLTDDRLVYSNTSIRDLWIWFELKIKSNFSV